MTDREEARLQEEILEALGALGLTRRQLAAEADLHPGELSKFVDPDRRNHREMGLRELVTWSDRHGPEVVLSPIARRRRCQVVRAPSRVVGPDLHTAAVELAHEASCTAKVLRAHGARPLTVEEAEELARARRLLGLLHHQLDAMLDWRLAHRSEPIPTQFSTEPGFQREDA